MFHLVQRKENENFQKLKNRMDLIVNLPSDSTTEMNY